MAVRRHGGFRRQFARRGGTRQQKGLGMNHQRLVQLFGRDGEAADEIRRIFPTESSARWFLRQHARELVERGAVLRLRGRWHAVMPRFEREALRLVRETTARAVSPGNERASLVLGAIERRSKRG